MAVGALLLIALFDFYRPETMMIADQVMNKPRVALEMIDTPKKRVKNTVKYVSVGRYRHGQIIPAEDGYSGYDGDYHPKGVYGEQNDINWLNYAENHMPHHWNVLPVKGHSDYSHSDNFKFGPNGTVHYVEIIPNWE